ncbi:hypothetical protein ASC89_20830 [Devosia sp. Root413D1]|nr:hypothetical protein ASC89_20830 [Devosia sp. Root413D1]
MRSLGPDFVVPVPETAIRLDPAIACLYDAVIGRGAAGLEVRLSSLDPKRTRRNGAPRLRSYVYWLLRSSEKVGSISVTLSDGDQPSAATFSPSALLPDVTPLPDPAFFENRGYAAERKQSLERALPWNDRSAALVWRGGMNSQLSFDPDMAHSRPDLCSQRLLACLLLRHVPDTDVKFAPAWHRHAGPALYQQLGVVGLQLAPDSWLERKYALDIDGFSNAWSNLFTRLLFGCCVLKVESRHGFRQWYYDRLRPWEHYVPVAADLSDLIERFDWVRSHDAECRDIAQRGRQLALEMTLSAATAEAVALIEANWQRQRGHQ